MSDQSSNFRHKVEETLGYLASDEYAERHTAAKMNWLRAEQAKLEHWRKRGKKL